MYLDNDTIVAISSPKGKGAIALIRLSGSTSIRVVNSILQLKSRKKNLLDKQPNTISFGTIKDGDNIVDDVMVSVFKKPKSFTGEDMVEISCHGSIYIQQKIIQLLLDRNIRLAKAGEFTMRAFMNGKMDLIQAEAITDIINSNIELENNVAQNQMRGHFKRRLKNLREELLELASFMELELDFSEEDVNFVDRKKVEDTINSIDDEVNILLDSFYYSNAIKNGLTVVIYGSPNVGKSSLLNTLLDEDKSIISDIAGTTRDYIEGVTNIGGFLFRFVDTAGIRKPKDEIEKIGIDRANQKLNEANIIIYLFDIDTSIDKINKDIEKNYKPSKYTKLIRVCNKIDKLKHLNSSLESQTDIFVSAKYGNGIDKLKDHIKSVAEEIIPSDNLILINSRHYQSLKNISKNIKSFRKAFYKNMPTDILSIDIKMILDNIGEITGEITNDDILNNIFSKFCIGK